MIDRDPKRPSASSTVNQTPVRPGAGFRCPKCGAPQRRSATCSHCGIAIDKYLSRQRDPSQQLSAGRQRPPPSGRIPYRLFTRLLQLLLLLSIGLGVWSYQQKDRLPDPDHFDQASLTEPLQTKTARAPFEIDAGGITYQVNPQFDYQLNGVVVSFHDSDSWWDIYHQGSWQDFINVKDLCVIWGDNVASGVYQELAFKNSTWTCWVSWSDRETGRRFQMAKLSNNHLLVHDADITQALREVEVGDQISLSGVLASYSHSNNQFQRGTSTTRTDTGNGACETIYIDNFSIVREANSGWRQLYAVAKGGAILSLLGLLVLIFVAPVRRIA